MAPTPTGSPPTASQSAAPEQGQFVEVRRRQWVDSDVGASEFRELFAPAREGLVTLVSVDEESLGEECPIVRQLEPRARVIDRAGLPSVTGCDEADRTGPATGLVPIRHTAQVLTCLIDESRKRLFLVSFVAYNVHVVIDAMHRATERGVRVSLLFESSKEQGGNVTVDSPSMLKLKLPTALFYEWDKAASGVPPTATVQAKCAAADGSLAFVTSANLSDAAMERNIKFGILVRGGAVPRQLDMHLEALITTRQLNPL